MSMSIQTAILPHKHVRFCDSMLALAGFLRQLLEEPRTIDELWSLMSRDNSGWTVQPTFTPLVLAVNILFAIGQVEEAPNGRVRLVMNINETP